MDSRKKSRWTKIAWLLLLMLIVALRAWCQVEVVESPAFRSVYDLQVKCPKQVEWMITRHDLGDAKRMASWKFTTDLQSPLATARHSDYTNSGYQRGHLCPAQDRSYNQAYMRSTFRMSNIAPQVPALNTGKWKISEMFCRNAAEVYDSVCVIVLPVFLNRDTTYIGTNRLAVPHAFFKAAWLQRNDSVIGTWFLFNR